jgi:hypothetical protein
MNVSSIHLFFNSMDSGFRLLFKLVKVVREFGLSGHAAEDCRLGWFKDGIRQIGLCNSSSVTSSEG